MFLKENSFKKLEKSIKELRKEGKKREKNIKNFKEKHFSEEMISELNDYFNRHHGMIEIYIDKPWGDGIEGTEIYKIFEKYGRVKDLKKTKFPIVWKISEGKYYLDLGT